MQTIHKLHPFLSSTRRARAGQQARGERERRINSSAVLVFQFPSSGLKMKLPCAGKPGAEPCTAQAPGGGVGGRGEQRGRH